MNLIVGAGHGGCYTAAHFINTLDETSYTAENEIYRPKDLDVIGAFHKWYRKQADNVYLPNALYIHNKTELAPAEKDHDLRASESHSDHPAIKINKLRDLIDDPTSMTYAALRPHRPISERREEVEDTVRKQLETLGRLDKLMYVFDNSSAHNGDINLVDDDQLIPSLHHYFLDELSPSTKLAIIPTCGIEAASAPTDERTQLRLVLQSALNTYSTLYQDCKGRPNTILLPAFHCPLVGHPNLSPAPSSLGHGRGFLDMDTRLDKSFSISILLNGLDQLSKWSGLTCNFTPLVSASVGMCPASLDLNETLTDLPYIFDATSLDSRLAAPIAIGSHGRGAMVNRCYSNKLKVPSCVITKTLNDPLSVAWSCSLRTEGHHGLAYGTVYSSAVVSVIAPEAQECTYSALNSYNQVLTGNVLARTDIVDRSERDPLIELSNQLQDIRDDCGLTSLVAE